MNRLSLSLSVTAITILLLGLLMIYDITAAEVLDRELNISTQTIFFKQFSFSFLALAISFFMYRFGYEKMLKLSPKLLVVGGIFLFLVFLPKIGMQKNGAHRWISIFGVSFQPSEFMKFILPLFYIHQWLKSDQQFDGKTFFRLFGILSFFIGLILFEPDNGTAAIIFFTLFALFFLTKVNWKYWVLPLFLLMGVGIFFATQMKHVPDRIRIYLNPELDILGKGHQPYQAKIATGSGGLLGKGFGESLQKFNYLPEARSDYIAAIYAEEFGFLGMLGLIFLYMVLAFIGFRVAMGAKDQAGFVIASIFTFLICFQAFINLGVVSNLLPSKGTNLPFFSQGGSSLLANIMALSIILDINEPKRVK